MKIYNHTKIDDSAIAAMLKAAAKGLKGLKTARVVVEVSAGKYVSGAANDYVWKRIGRGKKRRTVRTPDGWCSIVIPKHYFKKNDALTFAESVFTVARHELAHVRDFQHNAPMSRASKGGRRPRWTNRVEEIAAEAALVEARYEGHAETRYSDEIINLAIAMEAAYGIEPPYQPPTQSVQPPARIYVVRDYRQDCAIRIQAILFVHTATQAYRYLTKMAYTFGMFELLDGMVLSDDTDELLAEEEKKIEKIRGTYQQHWITPNVISDPSDTPEAIVTSILERFGN